MIWTTTARFLGLLIVVLALGSCGLPADALGACANPRLPSGVAMPGAPPEFEPCAAVETEIHDGSAVRAGWIVRVSMGLIAHGDVFSWRWDFFFVNPYGSVDPLGSDAQQLFQGFFGDDWHWSRTVAEQRLQIDPGMAGGTCCFNPGYFARSFLVRQGDRVCVAHEMRAPFAGRLRVCRSDEYSGEAGYLPGVTTWLGAIESASEAFRRETGIASLQFGTNGMYRNTPLRRGDGSLVYLVTLDGLEPSGSAPSLRRFYLVEASGGAVTLVSEEQGREIRRNPDAALR